MAENRYEHYRRRLRALGLTTDELGEELRMYLAPLKDVIDYRKGKIDAHVNDLMDDRVSRIEASIEDTAFIPPPCRLDGAVKIGRTIDGQRVGVSIGDGLNAVQHVLYTGAVAVGKTTALAVFASDAVRDAFVFVVDSQDVYRKIPIIREKFEFIDIRDLRLNPFDAIDGLAPFEQDQVVVKSLAANYGFQLAEHEIHLALEEVRAKTLVSFVTLRDHLAAKVYRGVTKRPRFRDAAVFNLTYLINGTYPLFVCQCGMDLERILTCGGVVLVLHSILPTHQAYLVRMIFDYAFLLRRARRQLNRPLLMTIDEAQLLMGGETNGR